MNHGYVFGDDDTVKRVFDVVRRVEKRVSGGGNIEAFGGEILYAEVTEVVSATEVKALQKVWDSSLATPAYAEPTGTAWIWDADDTTDAGLPNIFTDQAVSVGDVIEVIFYIDKSNTSQYKARIGGGGSSLIWLTTDNTGLSFDDGATYNRPEGDGSDLTVDDTYYIATPWNTRIVAPNSFFGYFVQDGQDWYHNVDKFYVKPTSNYPSGSGAGITSFTCYLNNADTSLNLGTNTAFPSGIKVILSGFDNVNAGSSSLDYFNGKVFPASFDSAANIIYLDHPKF